MPTKKTNDSGTKVFYIKTIISCALLAIIVLHLFSALPGLFRSFQHYEQVKRINFLNTVSDYLFTAVANYGFERGRVNVVLNDAGPVAEMADNRQFIQSRRKDGDGALKNALEGLTPTDSHDIKLKIGAVVQLGEKIRRLRLQTGKELVIPKKDRTPGLAEIWFEAMTAYIESIEALLVSISRDISNSDGIISRYSSLKHETLALRNTAGPEMSILSATILSRQPIKPALAKKIESLNILTKHHFQKISFLCQGLSSPLVPDALERLQNQYFNTYLPYRNSVLPRADTGGPYPYSQKEFLGQGVQALKEIAHFMDAIVSDTKAYATARITQSRNQILYSALSSAGSLIGVILIILFVNFKVIRPIGQLTATVKKLAQNDPDVDVPMLAEENEIGDMARSLEIFKGMAIQLEKDLFLLKKAESEKEQLIKELRKSLEKVKTLSGMLPICAHCKKIRDDKGYWNQIESYIQAHSDAEFSHSICRDCARELYPDLDIEET